MLAKEGLMCQKEKRKGRLMQLSYSIVQYSTVQYSTVPHVVFDKFDIGRYVDWAC